MLGRSKDSKVFCSRADLKKERNLGVLRQCFILANKKHLKYIQKQAKIKKIIEKVPPTGDTEYLDRCG